MTRLAALVALLAVPLCAAQVTVEVEPATPLTRRVLFVVDRSGSMHGDHFTRALVAMRAVAQHPTDDLEVGVIAFNETAARWPGKPEDGRRKVPKGWAALPSETAVPEAEAWLEQLGVGGDTLVLPALRAALDEPRGELSVVLVSDGLFGRERTEDILGAIAALQTERERRGHGRAVVAVYGLGACQRVLLQVARTGGGGYVREEVPLELDGELGTLRPVAPARQ